VKSLLSLKFSEGVLLGLSVAGTLYLVALISLESRFTGTFQSSFFDIASIIAILTAAYLTIRGISKQVQSNVELALDARERKLDAAKSTLSLYLSSLFDQCDIQVKQLINGCSNDQFEPFQIDEKTIFTLKECIELSTGEVKETLVDIIQLTQILRARQRDIDFSSEKSYIQLKEFEFEQNQRQIAIEGWLSLQGHCSSLFDFSRSRSPSVNRDYCNDFVIGRLSFLTDENDWLLDNDIFFSERLLRIKTGEVTVYFAQPGWRTKVVN
jgi:hypothetical protein